MGVFFTWIPDASTEEFFPRHGSNVRACASAYLPISPVRDENE